MIGKYFRYFFYFIKITFTFFVGKLGITFYQENVKTKNNGIKEVCARRHWGWWIESIFWWIFDICFKFNSIIM